MTPIHAQPLTFFLAETKNLETCWTVTVSSNTLVRTERIAEVPVTYWSLPFAALKQPCPRFLRSACSGALCSWDCILHQGRTQCLCLYFGLFEEWYRY